MTDRNHYRTYDDKRLLEEAKYGDSELALVLAERLDDALHDIETADRDEIEDLKREIEDLKDELSEARATINYLETELENAK